MVFLLWTLKLETGGTAVSMLELPYRFFTEIKLSLKGLQKTQAVVMFSLFENPSVVFKKFIIYFYIWICFQKMFKEAWTRSSRSYVTSSTGVRKDSLSQIRCFFFCRSSFWDVFFDTDATSAISLFSKSSNKDALITLERQRIRFFSFCSFSYLFNASWFWH